MAYGTPAYDYASGASSLAQNKTAQDAAANYGRFMGQERFRRDQNDRADNFRRSFPSVGQHFTQRGLQHSGQRQQGQREFVSDYQKDTGRAQFEQAGAEQGFQLQQNERDAQYYLALQQLFERMSQSRASQYDPFAAVKPLVGGA